MTKIMILTAVLFEDTSAISSALLAALRIHCESAQCEPVQTWRPESLQLHMHCLPWWPHPGQQCQPRACRWGKTLGHWPAHPAASHHHRSPSPCWGQTAVAHVSWKGCMEKKSKDQGFCHHKYFLTYILPNLLSVCLFLFTYLCGTCSLAYFTSTWHGPSLSG